MKLFWMTTEDHDEDWFVVALNAKAACIFHEMMEGYDSGDATAEEILEIPKNIHAKAGWPSHELLIKLGAKFLLDEHSRVVEIAGRQFCEGMLQAIIDQTTDDIFEKNGQGRLNNTKSPSIH